VRLDSIQQHLHQVAPLVNRENTPLQGQERARFALLEPTIRYQHRLRALPVLLANLLQPQV